MSKGNLVVNIVSVGQKIRRQEDKTLLLGRGQYTADRRFENQTYGFVLRSDHAHAEIKSIDCAEALAAPGVLAIFTADDLEADDVGTIPAVIPPIPALKNANIKQPQKALLAKDRVRCVGDPVAFIVAETIEQAMSAAELVNIDYSVLDAVVDTVAAISNPGPDLWDDIPGNICFETGFGDPSQTDEVFSKAEHVVSQRITVNRVAAAPMENRSTVSNYDAKTDRWTVYVPTQGVFSFKNAISKVFLKEDPEKFNVIAGEVGGSFGMKGTSPESVLTVWASRKVGRPVFWENSRSDSFRSDQMGRDKVYDAELALDSRGNFLGLRVQQYANLGNFLGPLGVFHSVFNMAGMIGVYKTPVASLQVRGIFTNTVITGPYRGSARPDSCYVMERLIDLAADHIGIDPAELRLKNLITSEQMPYMTPIGETYDCGDFTKLQTSAMQRANYAGFQKRKTESSETGMLRGIGIANNVESAGGPGSEFSTISFDEEGKLTVVCGTTDQGQGHRTMYKQVISEALSVDANDVTVIEGDTDKQESGGGTGGSRCSSMGTGAILTAAKDLVEEAKRIAALLMQTDVEKISFENGTLTATGSQQSMTLSELARSSYQPEVSKALGRPGLSVYSTYSGNSYNYPSCCQVCEVEINPATGVVELINHVAVADVGRIINPLLVDGQIMGGITQALGQVFMENHQCDEETGQLLSGSFMDYAMPRAEDFCEVDISYHPTFTENNPLGAKGVGEIGTASAMPAAVNAVLNALKDYNTRHLDMPLTSEKIWNSIVDGS